eukprot:Rhum_TRINITY_DN14676_c12_g2::Rhum_TRINITY_DN14676_c12_g2_i1::g.108623::m.108623
MKVRVIPLSHPAQLLPPPRTPTHMSYLEALNSQQDARASPQLFSPLAGATPKQDLPTDKSEVDVLRTEGYGTLPMFIIVVTNQGWNAEKMFTALKTHADNIDPTIRVVKLELRGNSLGDAGCEMLVAFMAKLREKQLLIENLGVRDNGVTDAGVHTLVTKWLEPQAELMRTMAPLQRGGMVLPTSLNLNANSLSNASVTRLIKFAHEYYPGKATLHKPFFIALQGNAFVTRKGIEAELQGRYRLCFMDGPQECKRHRCARGPHYCVHLAMLPTDHEAEPAAVPSALPHILAQAAAVAEASGTAGARPPLLRDAERSMLGLGLSCSHVVQHQALP